MPADQPRFGKNAIDDLQRRVIALEKHARLANTRKPHLPLIDMKVQGRQFPQDGALVLDYRDTPLSAQPICVVKYGYAGEWHVLNGREYEIKLFPDGDAVTADTPAFSFMIPRRMDGFSLIAVDAFVSKVSTSGKPTFMVKNYTTGLNMLSVPLSIDVNELDTLTASVPAVINPATQKVSMGNHIGIDVTITGTGTEGAGVILDIGIPE